MNRKRIWTAAAVLYVVFIWSNSMKPADISSAESSRVLFLVQSLFRGAGINSSWITEHMIRKAAHFTEYAALGILLWNCMSCYFEHIKKRVSRLLLAGFLIPFCDETIQLFVEGRSGQISDVWLDGAGVAAGMLVTAAWIWRSCRRREKQIG